MGVEEQGISGMGNVQRLSMGCENA